MVYREHLRWDPSFSQPHTWRLEDAVPSIRARIKIASGPEHVLDLPLVELRMRQHDGGTWIAGPFAVDGICSLLELALLGAPEHVHDTIRARRKA